jgi:hypothetical protein
VTTIDDDLQREIDELVQSAEAWFDSVGGKVTAKHADRVVGYPAVAEDRPPGRSRQPVPGRQLADFQARVEPAPRRLVGRSPAPSTDPRGRRQ